MRAWYASCARAALRRRATRAGVRRRFAPHQLRHAHAIEPACEGVPLNVIQRQPGHRNLGVTSIYLQGIDPDEIIQTRPATDDPGQRRAHPAAQQTVAGRPAVRTSRSCSSTNSDTFGSRIVSGCRAAPLAV
jgi:hypothetical protein